MCWAPHSLLLAVCSALRLSLLHCCSCVVQEVSCYRDVTLLQAVRSLRTTLAGGHLMFVDTLLLKMMDTFFVDACTLARAVVPRASKSSLTRAQRHHSRDHGNNRLLISGPHAASRTSTRTAKAMRDPRHVHVRNGRARSEWPGVVCGWLCGWPLGPPSALLAACVRACPATRSCPASHPP